MKTDLIALVCACLPVACASGLERLAQHVVIVGLDGCRPEAIAQADAPVMPPRVATVRKKQPAKPLAHLDLSTQRDVSGELE
jgi:hypothetical protein